MHVHSMCLCVCDRIRTYLYNSKIETIFQVFCLVSKSLCPTGERFFFVKAKELFLLKLEKFICHLTHLNVPMWSTEMPINETLPGKKSFFLFNI